MNVSATVIPRLEKLHWKKNGYRMHVIIFRPLYSMQKNIMVIEYLPMVWLLAAAMNAPVTVMDTASEGGAWGMAILAAYMQEKGEDETLSAYLNDKIFAGQTGSTIAPIVEDVEGFDAFLEKYKATLPAERAAIVGMK